MEHSYKLELVKSMRLVFHGQSRAVITCDGRSKKSDGKAGPRGTQLMARTAPSRVFSQSRPSAPAGRIDDVSIASASVGMALSTSSVSRGSEFHRSRCGVGSNFRRSRSNTPTNRPAASVVSEQKGFGYFQTILWIHRIL